MFNKSSAVAQMGDRLATTDMNRKLVALCPFGGVEVSPHLTQCDQGRGLPPRQVSFWSIVHPTVWPQCTNVTDRTDRQTARQRSDSIGRTVLQTVAQYLSLHFAVASDLFVWKHTETECVVAMFTWMNYDVARTIKYTKHQVLWYRRQSHQVQAAGTRRCCTSVLGGVTASAIPYC